MKRLIESFDLVTSLDIVDGDYLVFTVGKLDESRSWFHRGESPSTRSCRDYRASNVSAETSHCPPLCPRNGGQTVSVGGSVRSCVS